MSDPQPSVSRQTNIAMMLTSLRLVLSPVFVFVFLSDSFAGALACLIIALVSELSDLFDGMVARHRNEVTDESVAAAKALKEQKIIDDFNEKG